VTDEEPPQGTQKPFLGVHMKCCNLYVRAYINVEGKAYIGWCPRCAAQVRIDITQDGGSTDRFFEAS